jgi:creatinine amidohydrolase
VSGRPYILAETTWDTVRKTQYQVAVLPWGATEAHNYHLPYATDTIQCDHLAALAAERAWDAGAKVTVLPTVPFGVQTGQLDIPLCINMNPSTQMAVLGDVAESLAGQGLPKLVILNGHGGNDFRQMIRELQAEVDIFLCAINWYKILDNGTWFDEPGDHAGEMETSLMMHFARDLVEPLANAGDGSEWRSRIAAFREGWAWAPRPWTQISADTGVGNPQHASAVKGEKFADAVSNRIASFLIDLAASDPSNLYAESP